MTTLAYKAACFVPQIGAKFAPKCRTKSQAQECKKSVLRQWDAASIFTIPNPQSDSVFIYTTYQILVRPQNMGAELPVSRI